jgi:hypothetical protein
MIRGIRIDTLVAYAFTFAAIATVLVGGPMGWVVAVVGGPVASAVWAVVATFFAGFVVGFWKGVAVEVIGEVKEPDRGGPLLQTGCHADAARGHRT